MGILSSKYDAPYKYFPEVTQHRELFDKLRLRDEEVGKIYKCFRAIDVNDKHAINVTKILIHLKLEKTFFTKRILTLLDSDCSGALDFGEFLVGVWNYCSIDNQYLEQFAFDLYDKDKSGAIDISEAQYMLKDIYGEDFDRNPRAKKVHQKLAELDISEINLAAFKEFAAKHKAMLYPAFALQLSLRKYIVGERFWKRQYANRHMISRGEYMTIEDILGEELFERQKQRDKGKKKHSPSHHTEAGRRGSKCTEESVPDTGRRGSKSNQPDNVSSVHVQWRRGSKIHPTDGTAVQAASEAGRHGAKDQHWEPDTGSADWQSETAVVGRKGSKVIDPGYRRGSKEISFDSIPTSGRKGSKVFDPSTITSLHGKQKYQRLISGHHQDKSDHHHLHEKREHHYHHDKPEIRRHSRSSVVHPTYTQVKRKPSMKNAVDKVIMQQHVKDCIKAPTRNVPPKTAVQKVSLRRNTHF